MYVFLSLGYFFVHVGDDFSHGVLFILKGLVRAYLYMMIRYTLARNCAHNYRWAKIALNRRNVIKKAAAQMKRAFI